MAVKGLGQLSLADALVPARLGSNARLDRIDAQVDWAALASLVAGLRDPSGPGRPAYPALMLLKAVVLQSLYGLSDPELEAALGDRLSFRRFVGLGLAEATPDHSTLCRFRNGLREAGLLERLFGEIQGQMEAAGLVLKRGTMLDATLIETAAARPPQAAHPARDPDAGFARRSGKPGSTYGYKAHVGVDQGSGLIRAVVTTPANVNDTTPADALVRGDERAVLGDAAYHTHARERALKARGIKPRLMRRPNKHHPVLPPRLKRLNRLIARQRAAVETTFATLKRRMGLGAIRYRGLARAEAQVLLAALAFNLRRWAALSPA